MRKIYINNYEKIINYKKESFNNLQIGDIVTVLYRYKYITNTIPLIRQFLGICISKNSNKTSSTFIVRNIIGKEGVEFQFNMFSLNLLSLKKIKMSKGNYVRNKLYYLRNRVAWESTININTI